MGEKPTDEWIYVVTDVELDGPWPGVNSMRSFASVAVSRDGTEHGRFEAVLEPLPGTAPDEKTLAWFGTQPGAWEAATTDPEPVVDVMVRYVDWLRTLPWPRTFAAFPMSLDGLWIDYYLRRFTRYGVRQGHHEQDTVFAGGGLCIKSYAAAISGMPVADVQPDTLPSAWFGEIAHSHRAIDDTLGYANLLVELLGRSGA
ncbi:MAG TPA: hypothetical protein VMF51_02615 [Nocardioides sp.]|uniref:hypothetical protein n=1 Tax=Nocardioides sp. TaxID=35761 RepID=UPI002D0CCD0F|nr:hypothetical protein [Nocardioides sp.]HTW13990.1 hypothetical protein [Nocardioides sp.]